MIVFLFGDETFISFSWHWHCIIILILMDKIFGMSSFLIITGWSVLVRGWVGDVILLILVLSGISSSFTCHEEIFPNWPIHLYCQSEVLSVRSDFVFNFTIFHLNDRILNNNKNIILTSFCIFFSFCQMDLHLYLMHLYKTFLWENLILHKQFLFITF